MLVIALQVFRLYSANHRVSYIEFQSWLATCQCINDVGSFSCALSNKVLVVSFYMLHLARAAPRRCFTRAGAVIFPSARCLLARPPRDISCQPLHSARRQTGHSTTQRTSDFALLFCGENELLDAVYTEGVKTVKKTIVMFVLVTDSAVCRGVHGSASQLNIFLDDHDRVRKLFHPFIDDSSANMFPNVALNQRHLFRKGPARVSIGSCSQVPVHLHCSTCLRRETFRLKGAARCFFFFFFFINPKNTDPEVGGLVSS